MREATDEADASDASGALGESGAFNASDPSRSHLEDAPTRSVLNWSVLRDRVLLALFRTLSVHRPYFRDGVESPPFETHREAVELDLSPLDGEAVREDSYDVSAETLAGSLTAGVRVARWGGVGAPTARSTGPSAGTTRSPRACPTTRPCLSSARRGTTDAAGSPRSGGRCRAIWRRWPSRSN